jgi:hypothetical protein
MQRLQLERPQPVCGIAVKACGSWIENRVERIWRWGSLYFGTAAVESGFRESDRIKKMMLAWYCHINYGLRHEPGQNESPVDTRACKTGGPTKAVSCKTWKKGLKIIHGDLLNQAIDPRRPPKSASRAGEDTDYDKGNLLCCQNRNPDEILNKSQRFPNGRSYLYPKKACATIPDTALHNGIIAKVHSPAIQLLYIVLVEKGMGRRLTARKRRRVNVVFDAKFRQTNQYPNQRWE